MTRFKAVDRETPYLLPASVQDWLPEQHLARFVVEVVSKLDLHKLIDALHGSGIGGVQSRDAAGDVVVRIRDGSVFKPEAGGVAVRYGLSQ